MFEKYIFKNKTESNLSATAQITKKRIKTWGNTTTGLEGTNLKAAWKTSKPAEANKSLRKYRVLLYKFLDSYNSSLDFHERAVFTVKKST